jgi:surface antigen
VNHWQHVRKLVRLFHGLLLAALMFGLLPFAPAAGAAQGVEELPPPAVGWSRHMQASDPLRFDYPDKWILSRPIENPDRVDARVMLHQVELAGPEHALITINTWKRYGTPGLEAWWREIGAPQYIGQTAAPTQTATLAGVPALLVYPETGLAARFIVLVAEHAGYVVTVEVYAPLYNYLAADETFRAVVQSAAWQAGSPGATELPAFLPPTDLNSSPTAGTNTIDDGIEQPQVNTCCGVSSPGNPFPCNSGRNNGNCTWWAHHKRPDIGCRINAHLWANCARARGYIVNNYPKAGDVIVYPNGRGGYDQHVAYVEEVHSVTDTTIDFTMSQMSWGFDETNNCNNRWVNGTPFRKTNQNRAHVEFIHAIDDPGIPTIQPGDGAPDANIKAAFERAYARVGGAAYLEEMLNQVHTWGAETVNEGANFLVQNFRETAPWNPDGDDNIGTITYNPAHNEAYVSHGWVEDLYNSLGGPRSWLGYPVEDETLLSDPTYYEFSQGKPIQRFERGFIATRNNGGNYEAHTYYPTVDEPTINVGLIEYPFAQLDFSANFQRAPGYPDLGDGSDAVTAFLVYREAGNEYRLPMNISDLHTAQLSIVVRVNQPIEFAVELANVGNGGGKKGSYPRNFVVDGTRRTVAARYVLGEAPATNGQYWNLYDGKIINLAREHNLPPTVIKAMIAHESAGLGTYNGKDPARAYLYEPLVDQSIQHLLGKDWAAPWLLPTNPPPVELRPCAATIAGGYDLPTGTTSRQMVDTYSACTNRRFTIGAALDFVAQYRIAASYGLAQMVYRWQHDRLPPGAAPETFYDVDASLQAMARKVDEDRNTYAPHLDAGSNDINAWDAVLQVYNSNHPNGNPAYTGYVTSWFAAVQPDLRLAYDTTNLPPFNSLASEQQANVNQQAAQIVDLPADLGVMDELIADVDGSGVQRLIQLKQIAGTNPRAAQVLIFSTDEPSSAVRWQSEPLQRLNGRGYLRVQQVAAFANPLIVVELPVGFHSQVSRLFRIEQRLLRELSPIDANGLPGFFSDIGPLEILDDGTAFVNRAGASPGAVTTLIYMPTETGYVLVETVASDSGTDTTAPVPAIVPSRGYDANDWYNQPLSTTFQIEGADLRSLYVSVTPPGSTTPSFSYSGRSLAPLNFAADGQALVTLSVVDFAGNSASTSFVVQLDQQAPAVEIVASPAGPLMHFVDAGSGLASSECSSDGLTWAACSSPATVVPTLGVRLNDKAGNTTQSQVQSRVPSMNSWWLDDKKASQASLRLASTGSLSEAGMRSPTREARVRAGEAYNVSVEVQAAATMTPTLRLLWRNNERIIKSEVLTNTAGLSGTLAAAVIAPRGATALQLELRATGTGQLLFDTASIRSSAGEELLPSGTFEGDVTGWQSRTWQGNLAIVSVAPRADGPGHGILVSAATGWNGTTSLHLANHSGNRRDQAIAKQRTLDRFAVVAGQSYQALLSVRTINLERSAVVRIRFTDANDQPVGSLVQSIAVTGSNEWQWLPVQAIAPEGAVYATVSLKLNGRGDVFTDATVLIAQ